MKRRIKNVLRQSPLARTGVLLFAALLLLSVGIALSSHRRRIPQIDSINPPVGSAGETLTISGRNFGSEKKIHSYVEIAGSKLTSSSYVEWTDTQIRVTLPQNVSDGLVFVGTADGRSEPDFFTNKNDVPVLARQGATTLAPSVSKISPEKAAVGQTVVISGANFGSSRGKSQVLFAAAWASGQEEYISASEENFDYEYWDDSEIRVKVPDGAADGEILVQTAKGRSKGAKFTLDASAGTKTYSNKRTYSVQVSADIDRISAREKASLTLHVPRPALCAWQPQVELVECEPKPADEDLRNCVLHKVPLEQDSGKKRFSQTFAVSVYEVESKIDEKAVRPYKDTSGALYVSATQPDQIVRSADERIALSAEAAAGGEQNPLRKARKIFSYATSNFPYDENLHSGSIEIGEILGRKKFDSYEIAMIFTALCRASGVPALPVGGIIVDSGNRAQSHWWTEIYIEKAGWIPADAALAAKAISENPDCNVFQYFGRMDNRHVAFSRGWNAVKPLRTGSKTVFRPRSYALQSVWEEVDSEGASYSSLWSEPVVTGTY